MSQRLWLLVEWVEESNLIPSYGIVSVGSLIGNETQLHIGKMIFVRPKHGNTARRAKIVKISDSKSYVKNEMNLLEREDNRMKNVLSLCMRTIREMKPQYFNSGEGSLQQSAGSSKSTIPQVIADSDTSSSSDDSEANQSKHRKRRHYNKSSSSAKYSKRQSTSTSSSRESKENANGHHKRRSMICSTPVPNTNRNHDHIKLTFDQGTQTDTEYANPPMPQIEKMETVIQKLYMHFLSLVSRMQLDGSQISTPDLMEPANIQMENEYPLQPVEEFVAEENMSNSNIENNIEEVPKNQIVRVRRVSAHTTHDSEQKNMDADMIPIGDGNAAVPARLFKEIDWSSYTSATRLLLQAVFPRKILATHSLTGKQSPAFLDRPPKKCLDPKVVNDIVNTVSEKCGVNKRLVRNSITVKCTDEAKLYRKRQEYKRMRQSTNQNQENIPPVSLSETPSSDDYSVSNA